MNITLEELTEESLRQTAAQHLVSLASDVIGSMPDDYPTYLQKICRVIALMEMAKMIPQWRTVDGPALIDEARTKDLVWVLESIQRRFDRV